jgi:hypothetical protein
MNALAGAFARLPINVSATLATPTPIAARVLQTIMPSTTSPQTVSLALIVARMVFAQQLALVLA